MRQSTFGWRIQPPTEIRVVWGHIPVAPFSSFNVRIAAQRITEADRDIARLMEPIEHYVNELKFLIHCDRVHNGYELYASRDGKAATGRTPVSDDLVTDMQESHRHSAIQEAIAGLESHLRFFYGWVEILTIRDHNGRTTKQVVERERGGNRKSFAAFNDLGGGSSKDVVASRWHRYRPVEFDLRPRPPR